MICSGRNREPVKLNNIDENMGLSAEYTGDDGLVRYILKLPVRYREMILLKYYHGYSTKEIAGIMGISESNASKLDQRTKKGFDELCREEGIF